MHSRSCYRITQLILGVVLLAPLGCAQVDLMAWRKSIPEASEKNPVFNIVCVWEPSEGRNVDGLPARGFAGQLFFFTRSSPTPVKVNGDVRIYVFDDLGSIEEQAKPIHQFDFLGDAWTRHLQDSTLGPSYNVFIPYTREGGWLTNCQLRLRLTSESGAVAYSDTVDVALPGPSRPSAPGVALAGGTTAAHPVGQHIAAQMRPRVESIQLGAMLRHNTVRPTVLANEAAPLTSPPAPAAAMAHTAVAQPPPRRFRLAAGIPAPSATYVAGQPAPRPVMPALYGGHPAVAGTGMPNQWPAYQPSQYQAPQYQAPQYQAPQSQYSQYGRPTHQPVVYHPEASGQGNTAAHPLGNQAVARHPLADALQ